LQNTNVIIVKLWLWQVDSSLALVLFATLFIGIMIGMLFSIPKKKKEKEQKVVSETKLEELTSK